jgi:hypothetical protein
MWSDIAISRPHRISNFCDASHIVDTRITIYSSFLTDVIFLALMLIGVLRWKHARQMGGIWGVMYSQVGISRIAVATSTIQPNSILVIGINICFSRHTCGCTSCGAFSPQQIYDTFKGWPSGLHLARSER